MMRSVKLAPINVLPYEIFPANGISFSRDAVFHLQSVVRIWALRSALESDHSCIVYKKCQALFRFGFATSLSLPVRPGRSCELWKLGDGKLGVHLSHLLDIQMQTSNSSYERTCILGSLTANLGLIMVLFNAKIWPTALS
jgi:hypothetical protein